MPGSPSCAHAAGWMPGKQIGAAIAAIYDDFIIMTELDSPSIARQTATEENLTE